MLTRFEPIRTQTHPGDDARMRLSLDIELAPIEAGARLTTTLGLEPGWFMVPFNALL